MKVHWAYAKATTKRTDRVLISRELSRINFDFGVFGLGEDVMAEVGVTEVPDGTEKVYWDNMANKTEPGPDRAELIWDAWIATY